MVDVAMRVYEYAPAGEPTLTTPSEFLKAIKGLKAGKAPGPNSIPNMVLRHLPKRMITFLTKVFKADLRRQYFPPVWKHARVLPILKPGKDPTLPPSYRPVSLLNIYGKLFEKVLPSRVLLEVNQWGCWATSSLVSDRSRARRCSWSAILKEST
jgi:hypothetical protein